MAASANDQLYDATIEHAIDVQRYSAHVAAKIDALLTAAQKDLIRQLADRLNTGDLDSWTLARLDALLASLADIQGKSYTAMSEELAKELAGFAAVETAWQLGTLAAVTDGVLEFNRIAPSQLYAGAMARPFQGRLLKEWMQNLEEQAAQRVRQTVRLGWTEGQTVNQIVGFVREAIEIDRRNAEAIVRTAIRHTGDYAARKLYEANDDIIAGERWTATLDGRTSPVCRARDGKMFPLGGKIRPPAHFNCRSTMVPVLKHWQEMGYDVPPGATRASLDGQVPADLTYQDWLKKKPASYQDDILGPTRGKLFRDGGLSLDRFVDRNGAQLTLEQLRGKYAAAFERSGL